MTGKDDEIVALLRELVAAVKENSSRYADAVKQNAALLARNRTIAFAGGLIMIFGLLLALHFRWF
jgi:hypothetical protein